MKRTLTAALLALAVPAAVPALSAPADDTLDIQIGAGRLAVMMTQAEGAYVTEVTQHHLTPPDIDNDDPRSARAAIYDSLLFAVHEYNLISHQACRVHAVGSELCLGPYLPPWLGQPRDYSNAQLRSMTDEATGRLMPFWSALCARVQGGSFEQPVCPME